MLDKLAYKLGLLSHRVFKSKFGEQGDVPEDREGLLGGLTVESLVSGDKSIPYRDGGRWFQKVFGVELEVFAYCMRNAR